MQPDDRTIHFSTELFHPPVQHQVQTLQKLYYELGQTKYGYLSSDFSVPGQYKFHSRRNKSQSIAMFLPDRIVLVEEWADLALSDFCDKVQSVTALAMNIFGNVSSFAAQTATIRSTFALTHFEDARVFLLDNACGMDGRIGPHFQRPIAVGGLRFVLPETPDHPGTMHVIIESFRHDPKEVFTEVKGVFGNLNIDKEGIGAAIANIHTVRNLIKRGVFNFLNQFDHPAE